MARFSRLEVLNTIVETGLVPVFYHSEVAVARKIIEPLRQDHGFQHTDKVVDGYEVSAWKGGA